MNRPLGKILIQYDPNTGELDYKCQGLSILEVSGLLNFIHHKQLNKLGIGMEEQNKSGLVIASAADLPDA
jgi:hypothetical protein